MSDYLTEEEVRQWTAFRNREAAEARKEIFTPTEQDIQLSEIKERLQKIALARKEDCDCAICNALREIISRIEKAERRYAKT